MRHFDALKNLEAVRRVLTDYDLIGQSTDVTVDQSLWLRAMDELQQIDKIAAESKDTAPAIYGPRIEPRKTAPIDTRILGWCADEKVWKIGRFIRVFGRIFFKHEGQGPCYGEHEVTHWTELPAAP